MISKILTHLAIGLVEGDWIMGTTFGLLLGGLVRDGSLGKQPRRICLLVTMT